MASEVAVFELDTRSVRTVLRTERLVEAPNWTPDGEALIVNGDGRLYRVDLSSPHMVEIDTGFATSCNNDHGISPDGRTLVISDSTESSSSRIYTLPFEGGTPALVTEKAPSYWHGWSPDGSTLAYVGKRGDTYQVYTCPVGGGEEFQVTHGFDHCDGPDYTPDGQWIWFNGEKHGEVDLWRVRPNGGDVQRMTGDACVNWFPHPSPDGRHVLYLAYKPGVKGHPRGEDVELRLLPADGGRPETLVSLFGGQGTINVPCWAPGGKRFAFVRYSR
jgi:Tol biopolymer transport system component